MRILVVVVVVAVATADVETMKMIADVEIMIMKIADVDEIMMIIGERMIDVETTMIVVAAITMIVTIAITMIEDDIEDERKDSASQYTSMQHRAKRRVTLCWLMGGVA